jgi:TPR repeat protein
MRLTEVAPVFVSILIACFAACAANVDRPVQNDRKIEKAYMEYQKAMELLGDANTSESEESRKREAFSMMQSAAQSGLPEAQYNLAHLYWGGVGIEQNNQEAMRWFKESANSGFVTAQEMLGVLLIRGNLGVENKCEGLRWLQKAKSSGSESALVRYRELVVDTNLEELCR